MWAKIISTHSNVVRCACMGDTIADGVYGGFLLEFLSQNLN